MWILKAGCWCPHIGPWKHRDIEGVVGQTTVRAITSCSHCLSGDESRDKGCECRLLCRQQSRLVQPAWIVDAWLCSSGQRCSTSFQWTVWRRLKRLCVCKTKWGHTKYKGKFSCASSVSAVTAGVYFKILFWWWDRHILIDEGKDAFVVTRRITFQCRAVECYLWSCGWLLMPVNVIRHI